MSLPSVLRFNPSLTTFPTFYAVVCGAAWVLTLGRRGVASKSVAREIAGFGLPADLATLAQTVARATRLWPGEQREVARELASHFREGLDAGRDEEALRTGFGDPAVSARLIRRAAKRKRPVGWRIWVGAWKYSGMLLLVMFVAYCVSAAMYFAGDPRISRNYFAEINDAIRKTPEDQRAWPEYRRAIMTMPALPDPELWGAWPAIPPEHEHYQSALNYNRASQPALDIIRRAAARGELGAPLELTEDVEFSAALMRRRGTGDKEIQEYINQPRPNPATLPGGDNPELIGVLLPHLGQLRAIARDLMFDGAVARREGDADRVRADIHALIGIADQTGRERTLIGQLVGYAILHVACDETKRALTQTPDLLSDNDLTSIAHSLSSCIRPGRLQPSMVLERAYMDDLVQRAYTDNGEGDGHLTNEGMELIMRWGNYDLTGGNYSGRPMPAPMQHATGPVLSQVLAGRRELLAEYNRLMDSMIADAERPRWERMAHPAPDEFDALCHDRLWTARHLPLKVLMPALGACFRGGENASFVRETTCAAIACEVFRRRTGGWPTTLSELTPGLLPDVPLDLFTGREVVYAMVDGKPVIYSTGNDQDDDHAFINWEVSGGLGAISNSVVNGDWVLWPLPEQKPAQ